MEPHLQPSVGEAYIRNMTSNAPSYPSSSPPIPLGQRKVAIPRLQNTVRLSSTTKDRRRVSRACTACRSHKIKCTGERPQCKHCASTKRECEYILPRKDRLKVVTSRCRDMAALLRELKANVNAEDNAKITEMLSAVEEEISEAQQLTPRSNADTELNSQGNRGLGIVRIHQRIDTESLDLLDENLSTSDRARATGFVGKNSEIQWLRAAALAEADRADEEARQMGFQRRSSYVPSSEQVSSFSFWADDLNIDVDFYVDPYDVPQPKVAERLLRCYMSKVQDSFPILPRKLFEDQFRKYFTALLNENPPQLNPMWQAILNLVFAIGAKYSHLVKASWRADERDHLIYQARARAFGLNESMITNHSDLYQIQMLGLLAFYWLSVGQINRAWTIIGMALRSAFSLGFHIRNEDPSATVATREKQVRTWWSLYSLERTLSIVTGRPSIIIDSYCSVPWPMPVPEEHIPGDMGAIRRMHTSSMPNLSSQTEGHTVIGHLQTPTGLGTIKADAGSYFRATIQLSNITQSILNSLYSAGTMIRSPGDIQLDMTQLGARLDQWVAALPIEFNYQITTSSSSTEFFRERMLLGFQLCSARMLLTRPCLGSRRQPWREEHEAGCAKRIAACCIDAAKTIVDFLPEEPNPTFIYEQGPWWCIVHHMMQAISVFLLGLSSASSTSKDNPVLVQYLRKVMRWLRSMSDPVAERAYSVALRLSANVAKRLSLDFSDPWMENAQPTQGQGSQRIGPDADITDYMSTQFIMIPSSAAYATRTAFAEGGGVMTDAGFLTTNRTQTFSDPYHVAR